MRIILAVIAVLLLVSPNVASGQTVFLHGAGGPTMLDRGSSVAAGVGFSPTSRLTVMVDVERTNISAACTPTTAASAPPSVAEH